MIVEVPERPLWSTSRFPYICRNLGQEWYHSRAPLKGIHSIRNCRGNTAQVCFGMEICYHDHSKEVLRHWRFDQCIETLTNQGDVSAIYFRSGFVNGVPCIHDIRFGPCSGLDQPGWVSMAMYGCLVWWFFLSRRIFVIYNVFEVREGLLGLGVNMVPEALGCILIGAQTLDTLPEVP
jgi:hypothetical protein